MYGISLREEEGVDLPLCLLRWQPLQGARGGARGVAQDYAAPEKSLRLERRWGNISPFLFLRFPFRARQFDLYFGAHEIRRVPHGELQPLLRHRVRRTSDVQIARV